MSQKLHSDRPEKLLKTKSGKNIEKSAGGENYLLLDRLLLIHRDTLRNLLRKSHRRRGKGKIDCIFQKLR